MSTSGTLGWIWLVGAMMGWMAMYCQRQGGKALTGPFINVVRYSSSIDE